MEADSRHVEEVIATLGLERANTVATPFASTRDEEKAGQLEIQELERAEATTYRAVAARLNYLALDRPDIRFAVTRACAAMSKPTNVDWAALKRIGRYLKGRPRAAALYQ